MCWDNLGKRKSEGGLGFRQIFDFNIVLLGIQGCRVIQNLETLVAKLYRSR